MPERVPCSVDAFLRRASFTMKKITTVKQYFASLAPAQREALEELREIILAAAPDAEECVSYSMPALRLNGMLVYYAAFTKHISLFPGNAKLIEEQFGDQLEGYVTSKGTIQFPIGKKLPAGLIKKIVKARVKDNLAKLAAKSVKR